MKKYILAQKKWLFLCVLSVLLVTVADIAKAFLMQYIINSALTMTSQKLMDLVVNTLLFCVFTLVVYGIKNYCTQNFVKKCMTDLKRDWYRKLENKEIYQFTKRDTSTYLSNLTADVTAIETDYMLTFIDIVGYGLSFVLSFFAIVSVHYSYIIYIMIVCWLPILINHLWSPMITKKKLEISEENSLFVNNVKEFLAGFETIKLFLAQDRMRERFDKRNDQLEQTRFQSRFIGDLCESCSYSASLLIWLGSLVMGCYMVMVKLLTVGEILGVNQLLNNIVNPLYRFSLLKNKLTASNRVYEKISSFLDEESTEVSEMEHKNCFKSQITFQDISVSIQEKQLLNHINLTFEKGKKYLLVGESGSGKSTSIKLLMNCFEAYEGKILVDDNSFECIDKKDWFSLMSVVRQQEFIFHGTVRENIQMFDDFEQEILWEVIRLCRLEKLIEGMPQGLDTMLVENGINISGGERQRICLARAILQRKPILILDEATSALDNETSLEVEKEILSMKDVTVIVIAHKILPELLEMYDSVLTFKNGGII